MALTELKINRKPQKDISGVNSEEDVEILFEDDDFNPNLGLDDDDDDFEIAEEEDNEEEYEDTEEDDLGEGDDEEEAEEPEEKPRGKRENDRIRTLIEERNRERDATRKAREENLSLQKQMVEMQKKTVESTKGVLKNHVDSLKAQMAQAHENDDTKTYVDLNSQLTKAQTDLAALEAWEAPEIPKEIPEEKHNDTPQAFMDWSYDNPWFAKPESRDDRIKKQEAIDYSETLVKKGYSMETKEFFDMIDDHIDSLGLAEEKPNEVKSKQKSEKSSKRRKKSKISQTVQGASRTTASKKKSNKNKIVFTKSDLELIDALGLTPAEYAEEMIRLEKTKKTGSRMTPLKL